VETTTLFPTQTSQEYRHHITNAYIRRYRDRSSLATFRLLSLSYNMHCFVQSISDNFCLYAICKSVLAWKS